MAAHKSVPQSPTEIISDTLGQQKKKKKKEKKIPTKNNNNKKEKEKKKRSIENFRICNTSENEASSKMKVSLP